MPNLPSDFISALARIGGRNEFPSMVEDVPAPLRLTGLATAESPERGRIRRPVLKRTETTVNTGGPFQYFPVPGGTFANDWGVPRPGGRTHQGNDIFAAAGTPIYAVADGVVQHGEGGIAGKYFHLFIPGQGYVFGAHLSRFGKAGKVKAGDIIGYVGNTGNAAATPPHLHFEWKPGSGAVGQTGLDSINPYNYLMAAKGEEPKPEKLDRPKRRKYAQGEDGVPPPTPEESALSAGAKLRPPRNMLGDILQERTEPRSTLSSAVTSLFATGQPVAQVQDALGRNRKVVAPEHLTPVEVQVWKAFMDKKRPDLAKVVGTKEWRAWVGRETAGTMKPSIVSGRINQGMVNGGLFQFWYGHPWAQPYFTKGNNPGSRFTMTAYEQALALIQWFQIEADEIRQYGRTIMQNPDAYEGWG